GARRPEVDVDVDRLDERGQTRMHAALLFGAEILSSGSASRHSGRASGQRGWNGQPAGRSEGLGGSPPSPAGAIREVMSPIRGNAAASPVVYGWVGPANTSWAFPSSTIRPAYMMASCSQLVVRTERSWVMNSSARSRCCFRSDNRLRTWA